MWKIDVNGTDGIISNASEQVSEITPRHTGEYMVILKISATVSTQETYVIIASEIVFGIKTFSFNSFPKKKKYVTEMK